MDTITIEGKKYMLVPVEEEKKEPVKVMSEYLNQDDVIIAVPKVDTYREKFKNHNLSIDDVTAKKKLLKDLPKQDRDLDKFSYRGEKLIFGEGVQEEF